MASNLPHELKALQALLGEQVLGLSSNLLDLLPFGVCVCDTEGRIVRYNRTAAEMWRREPDSTERFLDPHRLDLAIGSPIAPEDGRIAEILRGGAPVREAELVMERADGTPFVARANIDPLKDESGRIVGVVSCFREVTGQHREKALARATEWRPLAVLDALPTAVYTTDATGRITFFNQAAADLWGCRPELGKSEFCGSWKLFSADGSPLPHAECPMAVALREQRAVRNVEAIAERPDGVRVPFMPLPTPLYDEAGRFIGAVNVLVDITERKRADEELSRKADELSALYRFTDRLYRARTLEQVHDAALEAITAALGCPRAAVLLFDPTGVMRFVAWRGLSDGYRKAVEGHTPWHPGEPDAQAVCIEDVRTSDALGPLRAAVLDEGIGALAFIPVTVDGGVVGKFMAYFDAPHSFSAHELELATTIARHLGFGIGRRRAEEASRLLAAVVDSSDDAILTKNLDGIITSWNDGARRLFGYSRNEVIGKPVTILMPPDRQSEEPVILARIRSGQRIDHYETVRQRKDGSLIDISLTVSSVKDATGAIVGASKIARDITDRRRAQHQQQMVLKEMDHRIRNLFTLASSVVTLSARSATSPEMLAATVHDRLAALARAHALTLANPSAQANRAVDRVPTTTLQTLIKAILSPYKGNDDRLAVSGFDCAVSGRAITAFALLFNEFATNAAKYGSLSTADGTVSVDIAGGADQLHIVWAERGGPAVQDPGLAKGFGSTLAQATVTGQFAGELSRDWQPGGLVIRLTLARDRLAS